MADDVKVPSDMNGVLAKSDEAQTLSSTHTPAEPSIIVKEAVM